MPLKNQRPSKEFRTRGPFDNTIDYDTDDRVSHNGMSYVAPEPIPAGDGVPNPGTNKWIDDPGSEGQEGRMGGKGDGVRAVYIRVAEGVTPVSPTGTWDGVTLALQGGWVEGQIPSGTGIVWRADVELDSTANTATFTSPERWTGPKGDEPSNTRLSTLIASVLSTMDLLTATEIQEAIAQYLTDNDYINETQVLQHINEAYLNVLRDLGIIQVEYSLNGRTYHPALNVYNFVRIRLNNPDADWHIIEVGSGSGGGVGMGNQRYFVEDGNVSQVTTEITLTIPGVTTYATGMKVEFEVEPTATGANPTLRINALDFKRLLKFDGTAFEVGELRQGIKVEATYDGTDFISDFGEEPHFHYVLPGNVAVSADGNDYVLTDSHIIGFGVAPPSLIGFKTKRTNTGNMTLVVNGSLPQPMVLADGSQATAGALGNNQFILMDLKAGTGWVIQNVTPSRSLKGQLLARCAISTGMYSVDTGFSWAIESGVTIVTTSTIPAGDLGSGSLEVPNGYLNVPQTRQGRTSQLGWYVEVYNGSTVVYEEHYPLNNFTGGDSEVVTTDGLELNVAYQAPFPPTYPLPQFFIFVDSNTTITSGNAYEVRLYLSEN